MCGRYTLIETDKIKNRFNTQNEIDTVSARYNIAPGSMMPVVIRNSPNTLQLMRWGLIPFWAKDPKIGYRMINARAEEIEKKPSFRKPIRTQRCLIPASGFYEWDQETKQPYYFKLKNQPLFGFAGIYDIWEDVEKKKIYSYSIITTSANRSVAKIHHRMPVIISQKDEAAYLTPTTPADSILKLLRPASPAAIIHHRVSKSVNTPKNDTPDLINSE